MRGTRRRRSGRAAGCGCFSCWLYDKRGVIAIHVIGHLLASVLPRSTGLDGPVGPPPVIMCDVDILAVDGTTAPVSDTYCYRVRAVDTDVSADAGGSERLRRTAASATSPGRKHQGAKTAQVLTCSGTVVDEGGTNGTRVTVVLRRASAWPASRPTRAMMDVGSTGRLPAQITADHEREIDAR